MLLDLSLQCLPLFVTFLCFLFAIICLFLEKIGFVHVGITILLMHPFETHLKGLRDVQHGWHEASNLLFHRQSEHIATQETNKNCANDLFV